MGKRVLQVGAAVVVGLMGVSRVGWAEPPQINLSVFPLAGPSASVGNPATICGCTPVRITWLVDKSRRDRATSATLIFYEKFFFTFLPVRFEALRLAPPTREGFDAYYDIRDVEICSSQKIELVATNARSETATASAAIELNPSSNACPAIQSFEVAANGGCSCNVPVSWTTRGASVELRVKDARTGVESLVGSFAARGSTTLRTCDNAEVRLTAVNPDGGRVSEVRSVRGVRNVRLAVLPGLITPVPRRSCAWTIETTDPVRSSLYSPEMRILRVDNAGRPIRLTRDGVSANLETPSASSNAFNGMTGSGSWLAEVNVCASSENPSFTATIGCPDR